MTVRDALAAYRGYAPDLRDTTLRKMTYEVNRWERLAAATRLADITLPVFSHFRARALESGLAPDSIETNIDTVHLLMVTCKSLTLFDGDIPAKGRRLKKKRPKPEPVTNEEISKLVAVINGRRCRWPDVERSDLWWRSWMANGLWTGLRFEDLTWLLSPTDFLPDRISIDAEKTGKPHVFPLPGFIRENVYHVHHPAGRSPKILRAQLKELCEQAGIRPLVPQNFRQGAVTMWTTASEAAGKIIHGCGLPSVMRHYVDPLPVLQEAMPRVDWPEELNLSPDRPRQLTLF